MVFGNLATVVVSCKMLHWMQIADRSKCVSKHEKNCFSHNLQEISTLRNFQKFLDFGKFLENFFCLNLFFLFFFFFVFTEFIFDKNVFSDNFFSKNFLLFSRPLHCIKVICIETTHFT